MNENFNAENKITLIYRSKESHIQIFGYTFVENNKNICKILHNDKLYDLVQYWESSDELLTIQLVQINSITNASDMFYGCSSLYSLPDISNWKTDKISNMKGIFGWCSLLKSLRYIKMENRFCY